MDGESAPGTLKVDIFSHIYPEAFYRRVARILGEGGGSGAFQPPVRHVAPLVDLDTRFRLMDRVHPYVQVLCLASPPIEVLARGVQAAELARLANDEMARLVDRYPDRFAGFVASLPLDDVEAAVREAERAVEELGATGIQIFTNVLGKPLDRPEFLPLFERMAAYDLPIWVHPTRGPAAADYPTEGRSRVGIWWALGWPYETAAFMVRLAFSGIFDRFPSLKIITHHAGGVLPYVAGRLGPRSGLERAVLHSGDLAAWEGLRRPVWGDLRMFYADTALFGNAPALACALSFFGEDRLLFGSDMPFGPEEGWAYLEEAIRAVDALPIPPEKKRQIFSGNAFRILRLRGLAGTR
ncbi:MAG: amidohydrolase family protein [Armatimonadota bacterium]|nr:amidohydrolase family protein [Armatimonadota bacterium]MDR7443199.1 amidohydrolase family protein [Armatimonadota bacterium]MDR7571106.1 amidohydrolase family protein [Armatimonadota bacterium]MDR7614585.1 amidohydrolase family protein [Armatimonadota bacterium]